VIEEGRPVLLSLPTRLSRIGQGKRVLIDTKPLPGQAGQPDPKLIRLLVRTHHLKVTLGGTRGTQIAASPASEELSAFYVT
jgi:hypothetical protein